MNESDIFALCSLQNSESRVFLSFSFYIFKHKRNQTIPKKNGFTLSHKASFPTAVGENFYSETVSGSLQKGDTFILKQSCVLRSDGWEQR